VQLESNDEITLRALAFFASTSVFNGAILDDLEIVYLQDLGVAAPWAVKVEVVGIGGTDQLPLFDVFGTVPRFHLASERHEHSRELQWKSTFSSRWLAIR